MIFFLETWPYAWKQNIFFMFWRKPGILISDLYLYSIKIQTNINQNTVKKYTRKSQIFWKYFFDFFLLGRTWPAISGGAGLALPGPVNKNKQWRTLHCSYATWTMEQPGRGRRKRREVVAYLAVIRSCRSWSCRLYAVGRWFCSFYVLFFLYSFFSPLLSHVSPFLLLLLVVVMSLLMVA